MVFVPGQGDQVLSGPLRAIEGEQRAGSFAEHATVGAQRCFDRLAQDLGVEFPAIDRPNQPKAFE